MLPELTPEEVDHALDGVAEEALAEAGIRQPPIDAIVLAETLGMTVALDNRQRGRARCARLGGRADAATRPVILLRDDPRPERRHWAVAHEIGEHLAWRVFARLGVDPREAPPTGREGVANQLAGRLLLPRAWFCADGRAGDWDLVELKQRYATASHELIARRMLEIPPPVIVTLFDQGRITWRCGNQPGRAGPPSPDERACWQVAHAENRPDRRQRGAVSIQAWPIHEPSWRREILRTTVPAWEETA
ncbi:MAG: ImmA/IrrE family metallo-endopeptidase [Pirellulales bacterium]|nr:ImmA/IrrE family metallo-endopeptidase [Pirellulales bacterium]